MIIHYNCTIGSFLLHYFLLIYHPYPPSFHEMIFTLVIYTDELAMTKPSPLQDTETKMLLCKIHQESERLHEQFSSLIIDTQKYLSKKKCDISTLLICIMDVDHVKDFSKKSSLVKLREANGIGNVFLELIDKELISFLKITIIKRIIRVLCKGSKLLKQLQQYEDHYNKYIQRRVCESTVFHRGTFETFTKSDSTECVELLLITDETWNLNTKFVKVCDLEEVVANALDIDTFTLQLVRIEPQCLKICFSISIHIAKSVFPLTQEEWNIISSHGVVEIRCLDHLCTTEKCRFRYTINSVTVYNIYTDKSTAPVTEVGGSLTKGTYVY